MNSIDPESSTLRSDALLRVDSLSYSYPTGQPALSKVSFVVNSGERVALLGPNGAGKTTLLMHLNGLLPGKEGLFESCVTVSNYPVLPRNFREVRKRVGFLFQDPDDQLFCPTVGEDIAFGPLNLLLDQREIRDRIRESLASVGLSGFEDRYTQQLSFGERKRVALAGVLACRPELLVLDEPTSNLDLRSRRRFIQILSETSSALLVATHDLEMVLELCSRVIVLDQGRIQADGSAREILSNSEIVDKHGLEIPLSLRK